MHNRHGENLSTFMSNANKAKLSKKPVYCKLFISMFEVFITEQCELFLTNP